MEIAQQTQYLQEEVGPHYRRTNKTTQIWPQTYAGNLTDDVDMSVYFYDLPTSMARRNRHLYPVSGAGGLKVANLVDVFSRVKAQPVPSDFIYPGWRNFLLKPVTRSH